MSETMIEQARFLSQIAAAYYDDEDNDEFRDDFAKDILAALRTARSEADAELAVMRSALQECRNVLDNLVRPTNRVIGGVESMTAWAQCVEAEAHASKALSASPRAAAVVAALQTLRSIADHADDVTGGPEMVRMAQDAIDALAGGGSGG